MEESKGQTASTAAIEVLKSKTVLLNLIVPALFLIPTIGPVLGEFVKQNPELVLSAWSALNIAARTLKWPFRS